MAGFFTFWSASSFLLLKRLVTAAPAEGAAAEQWALLLQEQGIRPERLPLLLADHLGPGLVRQFRGPAVVVPRELWDEASAEIRGGILRHELAHYRHGDMLRNGIARLLTLIHWFNPFSWFALRKWSEASEWLCDLAAFGDAPDGVRRFAESMLAVHEAAPSFVLNRPGFGGGKMTRRARMLQKQLNQPKESPMKKIVVSIILATVALLGVLQISLVPVAAEDEKSERTVELIVEAKNIPNEKAEPKSGGMTAWSAYYIESPDLLTVKALNIVPKSPYMLRVYDVVALEVQGLSEDYAIRGNYTVMPGGKIELGPYGSISVAGTPVESLRQRVVDMLKRILHNRRAEVLSEDAVSVVPDFFVSVQLIRLSDMEQIAGDHRVGPDGYITLGSYGRVYVNGLTVAECREAIEQHLSKSLDAPQVTVEVASMDSKEYYVIVRAPAEDMQVSSFPCTGNDTVLKAISNLKGTIPKNTFDIQHIRPGGANEEPVTTDLKWDEVLLHKSGVGHNKQLLPGDRLILNTRTLGQGVW